jgi:hypothetical protein
MTPWQANQLLEALKSIRWAFSCAADPHVDCREEMDGHLEDARERLQELYESTLEQTESSPSDRR